MPDNISVIDFPGDPPRTERNVAKFAELEKGRADLQKANQDITLYKKLAAALEKRLDHATGETARARIQMNAAKQAVLAALKNATGSLTMPPITDHGTGGRSADPIGPPRPGSPAAAGPSSETQAAKLQELSARVAAMQDDITDLRAQLYNLCSVGRF